MHILYKDIVILYSTGETIWINAVLHIVFKYVAVYCHIAICDWILGETFHMGILGLIVKTRIYTLYNYINSKKLKCISQVTRGPVVLWYND